MHHHEQRLSAPHQSHAAVTQRATDPNKPEENHRRSGRFGSDEGVRGVAPRQFGTIVPRRSPASGLTMPMAPQRGLTGLLRSHGWRRRGRPGELTIGGTRGPADEATSAGPTLFERSLLTAAVAPDPLKWLGSVRPAGAESVVEEGGDALVPRVGMCVEGAGVSGVRNDPHVDGLR